MISSPASTEVFFARSTKKGRVPVRVTCFCWSFPSGPATFTMISSFCHTATRSTGSLRSGRVSSWPGPRARMSARSIPFPRSYSVAETVITCVTELTVRGFFGAWPDCATWPAAPSWPVSSGS